MRLPLLPSHHFSTHQSLLIRIYISLIISKCTDPWAWYTPWTWVHAVDEFPNVLTWPIYIASDWFTAGSREVHAHWLVAMCADFDLKHTEHEPRNVNRKILQLYTKITKIRCRIAFPYLHYIQFSTWRLYNYWICVVWADTARWCEHAA